jgi:lactoylglutathione lyase
MLMQFAHPHIRVRDLPASLDFFCGKLGLAEISRQEVETPKYTLVYLAAPKDVRSENVAESPCLELACVHDDVPITDGTRFAHVAFFVDDLEQTCATLAARGVTVSVPPQPDGYAYILSPEGMTIELLRRPVQA